MIGITFNFILLVKIKDVFQILSPSAVVEGDHDKMLIAVWIFFADFNKFCADPWRFKPDNLLNDLIGKFSFFDTEGFIAEIDLKF